MLTALVLNYCVMCLFSTDMLIENVHVVFNEIMPFCGEILSYVIYLVHLIVVSLKHEEIIVWCCKPIEKFCFAMGGIGFACGSPNYFQRWIRQFIITNHINWFKSYYSVLLLNFSCWFSGDILKIYNIYISYILTIYKK